LTVGLSKPGGRNNKGRITMRHKGGGHKINIDWLILREISSI